MYIFATKNYIYICICINVCKITQCCLVVENQESNIVNNSFGSTGSVLVSLNPYSTAKVIGFIDMPINRSKVLSFFLATDMN